MPKTNYKIELTVNEADHDEVLSLIYKLMDTDIKDAKSFTIAAYEQDPNGNWEPFGPSKD